MIALIEALDRGLGTSTSLATLRREAARLDRYSEEAMAESEQLRELVRSLETQTEEDDLPDGGQPPASALPPSEDILAEVEAFLRREHDAGSTGTGGRQGRTPGW